ncbi:MAG: hypothetical protein ABI462_03495 [Ignavibacteria bacterium]
MKILTGIRILFLILLISSDVIGQDSPLLANDWFAEIQIANSEDWTLDVPHEGDISFGGRFKNIFLRINGGFNSGNFNDPEFSSVGNPVTLHRYSGGVDILYGIEVSKKVIFKTGLGYEYFYSKKVLNENWYMYSQESERKDFGNFYKLIENFSYSFTKNIYVFIQYHIAFEKHHGSQSDKIYSKTLTTNYFEYNENKFKIDNFILGGGISF